MKSYLGATHRPCGKLDPRLIEWSVLAHQMDVSKEVPGNSPRVAKSIHWYYFRQLLHFLEPFFLSNRQ